MCVQRAAVRRCGCAPLSPVRPPLGHLRGTPATRTTANTRLLFEGAYLRTRSACLCKLEGEASRRAILRARVAARERWRPGSWRPGRWLPGSRSFPPGNTCTSTDPCERHSIRPRTRRFCEACRQRGFVRALTMCVCGGSGGVTAARAGGARAHAPSTDARAASSTRPVTSGGRRTQAENTPSSLWVGSGLSAALPGRETLPPHTPWPARRSPAGFQLPLPG